MSRITARRAVQNLADEGLVFRLRGRGTFVAKPKTVIQNDNEHHFVMFHSFSRYGIEGSRILEQKVVPAGPDVAKRLGVAPGAAVQLSRRLFMDGDIAHAYNELFVAPDMLPAFNEALLSGASVLDLETNYYHVQMGPEETCIEAMSAPDWLAQMLSCETGSALFRVHSTLRDAQGSVVHYARTYLRGDRASFTFSVGPDGRFVG